MNEGLLILDAHRHVLLMNDSARAILHTSRPAAGKTPLSVYNRSQTLLDTAEKAIAEGGAHGHMVAKPQGRQTRLQQQHQRHAAPAGHDHKPAQPQSCLLYTSRCV